jgi:hypothetical protein
VVRPTLIELAVRVLRAAIERAKVERVDAPDVRLALRCLLPHVTDRQLLVELWSYAGQMHNANRWDSCDAVLQAVLADLRAAGRYPSVDQEARRFAAETAMQALADREQKRQVQRRHYFTPPPRRS